MIARLVKVNREGSKIMLVLRDYNLQKRMVEVVDFRPYFYIPDEKGEYIGIFGEKLRKIYVSDPSEVPTLREKYPHHYEADIPYTRRFMIDTGVMDYVDIPDKNVILSSDVRPVENNIHIPLRVWYLDIEVLSETLPSHEDPKYPICSITVYDSYIRRYYTLTLAGNTAVQKYDDWTLTFINNEDELIKTFLKMYMKAQPDIITGWNISFDINYLSARVKRLGYDISFVNSQIFDMLDSFRNIYKRPSYKLKVIAVDEGFTNTFETFNMNMTPEVMSRYNMNDVKYLIMLDERYKLLEYYWNLKEFVGVNHLEDTLYSSVLVDTALLRLARKLNIILPSKREIETSPYTGATVLEPPKGIYENVAVFDMNRYYPSIIISFNISPETISDEGDIRYGSIKFRTDKEGLIPTLCKYFMKVRDRIEEQIKTLPPNDIMYDKLKMKSNTAKYLINAIYGFLGYEGSRIYDYRLAETITAIGREGIMKCKEIAEKHGYKVLYGDTDSIMIQIPLNDVENLTKILNDEISKYFRDMYELKTCNIKLKSEAYYDRVVFFGVKKRYVAHMIYEKGVPCDKIKIVGLEAIRTDQSNYSRKVQSKLIEMILKGSSVEDIKAFIKRSIDDIKHQNILDIAIVKGIDKPLDEYKSIPPHVRGALWSNMNLNTNFKGGDRVYMIWVKYVKDYPKTDVIAFDEDTKLPIDKIVIDWDRMIDTNIIQKVDEILKVVGVDIKQILYGETTIGRWL
jgi:DNA polymerase I